MSNLIKRTVPVILVLALCISCLVSPVLAADDALSMINLLDYGFCSENGTNSQGFSGNSTVEFTYSFPSNTVVTYVDVVFTYSASADIPTINLYLNGSNRGTLNVVRVNGPVFRAYGSFNSYNGRTAKLVFAAGAESSNRISIESFKFGRSTYEHVDINALADVMSVNYNGVLSFIPGGSSNFVSFTGSSVYPTAEFGMQVYVEDWENYDYLDLYFYITCGGINSVACLFDGYDVPFTMAYIDSPNTVNNTYVFNVCIDVRNLDRSLESYPLLVINGNVIQGETNYIAMLSCIGSVYLDALDPDIFWYNRLWNSIVDGFDSLATSISDEFTSFKSQFSSHTSSMSSWFMEIRDQLTNKFAQIFFFYDELRTYLGIGNLDPSEKADDFNENVGQQSGELDDMIDIMDSVDRPDVNDVDIDFNQYVSQDDISSLTSPLTALFTGDIFGVVLILSIMMGTVSFVFYGKR